MKITLTKIEEGSFTQNYWRLMLYSGKNVLRIMEVEKDIWVIYSV